MIPCTQQHSIGFIVLCENIRNGRICHSPVQQLRVSVNHRMVHRVRPAAKIFTDFTSIDFEAAKLSRQCTARYGKTDLVYVAVRWFCVPAADSADNFSPCREMLHQTHKQNRILRMKLKIDVQSVRRVRQFCSPVLIFNMAAE